jgi:hypothetical protein
MKITSVLQLGKYKINDEPYWLSIVHPGAQAFEQDEDTKWVLDHHPKVIYDRKMVNMWDISLFKGRLIPKLHSVDFQSIMMMITGTFSVEPYKIENIARSEDTGEYYYMNDEGYWMPQAFLFDSPNAAYREKDRILSMIEKWLNNQKS